MTIYSLVISLICRLTLIELYDILKKTRRFIMKRVFISIISLAAALNLCACGDNSENKTKSREKSNSKVATQDTTEK